MKTNLLVFLVTVLVLAVIPLVLAADTFVISIDKVEVNDLDASTENVAVESGEIVPIDIFFTASDNTTGTQFASDVQISAWIQGERSQGVEKNFRDLIEGKEYIVSLALKIPTDLDELDEDITLFVRIETDEGNKEESFVLHSQREPDKADILFVEVDSTVDVGSNLPIDIVVKNLGRSELEDLIVKVSIPELGISKRAYFGDLTPTDDEDEFGEDAEDAAQGRIFLKIPTNVKAGSYELVVEAYNEDTISGVKKIITIVGAGEASKVIVPVTSKELAAGETQTYTIVLVNSGRNVGVYEIIPETAEGVIVSVTEPVITIPAGSSRVVEITVKAGSREGTYTFAVNVNSENQLVQRAVMTANVVKGSAITTGSNLTILTVILAIVFVVLLIVLIVLLTRKPEKAEEFEESYY